MLVEKEGKPDRLEERHFWAYGVGHFINDLTIACWLNFLVFYLDRVVKTPAAPYVFLVGQIADGVATPIVAILSDRTSSRLGKRIPWYIVGFVLTSTCVLPLYVDIDSSDTVQFVYYLTFGTIYSIGWAAIQVSHMSLVPSLTSDRVRRDRLNNLRTSFTYISNLVVLSTGVIIFQFMEEPDIEFLIVAILAQLIGTVASFFFMCLIRERKLDVSLPPPEQQGKDQQPLKQSLIEQEEQESAEAIENEQGAIQGAEGRESAVQRAEGREDGASMGSWFRMPAFYLCCVCYVGVRAYNNCYGVLLAFYLANVLRMGEKSQISFQIALVPLIIYTCATLTTSQLIKVYQLIGRKKALTIGTVFGLVSLLGMYVLTPDMSGLIYYFAIFRGVSSGLVLTTGTNLITEVIGNKGSSGAFVYGFYSFIDKCIVGLVVYVVTHTSSYSKDNDFTDDDIQFIRLTMSLVPSLALVVATLGILFCPVPEYNNPTSPQPPHELPQPEADNKDE